MEVVEPAHPATAHLGDTWQWHDEIYLFRSLRPDARVLLRLADGQVDLSVPGGRVPDCGFPLAWCHGEEKGARSTAPWATSPARGRPRPTSAIWPGASPGYKSAPNLAAGTGQRYFAVLVIPEVHSA